MSVQQRVNVYLRHRLHTLRQQDYLTSQEISQALGGGSNATPINKALLKLMGIGHVTRRMRPPANTYEWRATTAVTKAPTQSELQCLPPELLVQLEKADALATPAPIERRPIPTAAEVQRVGLPTVVVPAPTFGPPAPVEEPKPEPEPQHEPSTLADREAQAAEFRADVTAAALEAPECAEAPPAEPEPITTLSDVLERYRARQYDRLTIDDAAIIEIARVILQRQQSPAVFVSIPTSGLHAAFCTHPLIAMTTVDVGYPAPAATITPTVQTHELIQSMDSVLSQLAQPKRARVSVSGEVLWALRKLGPALPPPIAALLAEAHAILSQPLLTESEPAA